ncbi:MAG: hypothetical protein ACR2NA_12310 [Solirubrobacterales bacterium]
MSAELLVALQEAHAFDPFPVREDLGLYHVAFSELVGSTHIEATLLDACRRFERIAVIGDSGTGKMLLCLVKGFLGVGEEVDDLLGEMLGAGAREADGGDDLSVAASKAEEPDPAGRASSRAGGADVDLDGDGLHGVVPPWVAGVADKTGMGHSGEGKLLLGPLQQWR